MPDIDPMSANTAQQHVNFAISTHLQLLLLNGSTLVLVIPVEQVGIQASLSSFIISISTSNRISADFWADAAVLVVQELLQLTSALHQIVVQHVQIQV